MCQVNIFSYENFAKLSIRPLFFDRHKQGDNIILVNCFTECNQSDKKQCIEEATLLALASNANILHSFSFSQLNIISKTFLGSGKIEKIAQAVAEYDAEVVLFNIDLSPSQERNIEKLVCCRVLSRTGLILDIFASRAKTYEGKIQVELAQLQNLSTRLIRGWTHLERQKGGIGLRGPGESQLEIDRRLIQVRIKSLKKQIAKIKNQRNITRNYRTKSDLLSIALVGYTNAGKSSLFNLLTAANVKVKDQLFATLDTTIRPINLPNLGKATISDTVGFIQDLPHSLVDAFHATLEEAINANLLLHIVDFSNQNYRSHIDNVNTVLAEINADKIKQIVVYNKIDLLNNIEAKINFDADNSADKVWISVHNNQGINLLIDAIVNNLSQNIVNKQLLLKPNQASIRAKLYQWQCITAEKFDSDGNFVLDISIRQSKLNSLKKHYSLEFQQ